MKKIMCVVLTVVLCLFAGCGNLGRSAESVRQFRQEVVAAASVELIADVTADYGDRVQCYRLKYSESQGIGKIEVLAPETIAGITAHTESGKVAVSYDGAMLDAGYMDSEGLTPISALPAIVASMRSGHIENIGREKQSITFVVSVAEGSLQQLWLDSETLKPYRSEIRAGEKHLISCDIIEFSVT